MMMDQFLDTIADIMSELMQYGTADNQTVESFLEMLSNHEDVTGVTFGADVHGVVYWEGYSE